MSAAGVGADPKRRCAPADGHFLQPLNVGFLHLPAKLFRLKPGIDEKINDGGLASLPNVDVRNSRV